MKVKYPLPLVIALHLVSEVSAASFNVISKVSSAYILYETGMCRIQLSIHYFLCWLIQRTINIRTLCGCFTAYSFETIAESFFNIVSELSFVCIAFRKMKQKTPVSITKTKYETHFYVVKRLLYENRMLTSCSCLLYNKADEWKKLIAYISSLFYC